MKTYCTVALSMLAGAALGGAAIQALPRSGETVLSTMSRKSM